MADISKIRLENETYNIKDENARNDISTINNTLDNLLTKKKMIVIGDSYSASTQSGTPLWFKYIEKWDNLDTYTNASDGQGYSTGINTFLHQLQLAKQNVNLDEIDRIYIVGGLNDLGNSSLTPETFNASVDTTFQYVKDNFPNIKCYVIGILPFQFYNYYSNNQFFTDCKRAYNFQAFLSYTSMKYENIIFKSAQYLGLNIPGYFGDLSGNAQRHPSSYGQKVIANFIYNSQRLYGFLDLNNSLMTIPLTCDNGNASIDGADDLFITIKIENYNNNNALNIGASGLPIAKYPVITDEKGNSVFLYILNNNYHIGANTGLESGTLYANIPINWNS